MSEILFITSKKKFNIKIDEKRFKDESYMGPKKSLPDGRTIVIDVKYK